MYLYPDVTPRFLNAPTNDEEWEAALSMHCIDRDDRPARDLDTFKSSIKRDAWLLPRRGLEGSDASDDEPDLQGYSVRSHRQKTFGLVGLIGAPPVPLADDPDWGSADDERRRMREHYETEGWLPGPRPGHRLRMRRKRMIRRLGLAGDPEEDNQRKTIMAQYATLAQQMFNVEGASITILRDDVEYKYSADPESEPWVISQNETVFNLALDSADERCVIIPDIAADWRLKNFPLLKKRGMRFMAVAPLRYLRRHPPVDFGGFGIYGKEPREEFTQREQKMFLQLANMLVYQLATLQSEILAEKTSNMHENALGFLRRSVFPSVAGKEEAKPKTQPESKPLRRRPKKTTKRPTSSRSTGPSDPSGTDREEPPLIVKKTPKATRESRNRAFLDDEELFNDAAGTLRGILGADAVAFVKMEDYQLYFRRNDALEADLSSTAQVQDNPLFQFMAGQPWPEQYDPVIHHVPTSNDTPIVVLGSSAVEPGRFNFHQDGTDATLSDFFATFLKTRRFWWDRSNPSDELSIRMMDLMPGSAQTLMAICHFTGDGRIRLGTFAAWNRPPSSFADTSTVAMPFIHVLGGVAMAARSVRKIRAMEESQISYSNLQAHELRTPLHQILAITQLLRSAMIDLADAPQDSSSYQSSIQQVRDLLPILDAIDTSGKTLHGIVDNILSFLDLKAREYIQSDSTSPKMFDSPAGGPSSLTNMFEEVIIEACEEAERVRRAAMQPINSIETVFEMIPACLGENTMEDVGGALRKAVAKILSNAYKFIEGEGFVHITVKDAPGCLAPVGCADLARTRKIAIEIADNGVGMDPLFIKNSLGEAWAKQDPFTTGSGLSVHLAYRIVELMGGNMEIASGPGRGCIVNIEVPVLRRTPLTGPMDMTRPEYARKIALIGFGKPKRTGLPMLGEMLKHQYPHLGAKIVSPQEADLIIANGNVEEVKEGIALMECKAEEIVFLTSPGHEPHAEMIAAAKRRNKVIRRIAKPVTPTVLRQSLQPPSPPKAPQASPPSISSSSIPSTPDPNRRVSILANGTHTTNSDGTKTLVGAINQNGSTGSFNSTTLISKPPHKEVSRAKQCIFQNFANMWRPKGMCPEEAIACLSLGDYFSARRKGVSRAPSISSSRGGHSTDHTDQDTPANRSSTGPTTPDDDEDETPMPEPETVKVLVVEDNMINRKLLVRILSTKLPIEIVEAADGLEAVSAFKEFTGPSIVLLDINMPNMDGYQACTEFRTIERHDPTRPRAKVIAVTALSGDEEKHKGIVEAGMDQWLTKPCGKQTITKVVEEARRNLLGISSDDEQEPAPTIRRNTV